MSAPSVITAQEARDHPEIHFAQRIPVREERSAGWSERAGSEAQLG